MNTVFRQREQAFAASASGVIRGVSRVVACAALVITTASATATAAPCTVPAWPLWQDFNTHFVTSDARVLASSTASRESFSEAQAYAMFFALVANDPVRFDQLWRWTVQNLGDGNLEQRLPAWRWGRATDNRWRVLDANSASDADLWLAYGLLEAGRLWQRPEYTLAGQNLLKTVMRQEVVKLPGLGAMLLPGAAGFVNPDGSWRLNPSYLPIPLLRRFALESPQGPWNEIAASSVKMITATAPNGLIADWVGYRASALHRSAFTIDQVAGAQGSYDAIRVYLWAGMTPADDPLAASLNKGLRGMARLIPIDALPPEQVNTHTGVTSGTGPYGFSAALLPYLRLTASNEIIAQQAERVRTMQADSLQAERVAKEPPSYYDHALSLFGLGWIENRYRFLNNGQLQLQWQETCTPTNKKLP